MTNKLPKIGQRYRNKKTKEIVDATFERLRALTPPETIAIFKENGIEKEMLECRFLIEFEPLPSPKEQEEDKVQEAKEELKGIISNSPSQLPKTAHEDTLCKYIGYLEDRAQNLVNALESIKEPVKKAEESLPDITFADFIDYKTNNIETLPLSELVLAISDYFQRHEAIATKKVAELEKLIKEKLSNDN